MGSSGTPLLWQHLQISTPWASLVAAAVLLAAAVVTARRTRHWPAVLFAVAAGFLLAQSLAHIAALERLAEGAAGGATEEMIARLRRLGMFQAGATLAANVCAIAGGLGVLFDRKPPEGPGGSGLPAAISRSPGSGADLSAEARRAKVEASSHAGEGGLPPSPSAGGGSHAADR